MGGSTKADSELLVWDSSKTSLQIKLGELVQYFQVGIPLNNDGIPKMYIDPTIIMPNLLDVDTPDDLSDDVIEEAKINIDFDDGFPTIEGIPFWERLEGEPLPYYKLFKEYREMKYLGRATANGLLTRSIARLAESTKMLGKQLNALSRVYHWQVRARAYDKYKDAERALMLDRDRELLENKHAKISNALLDQAVDYLGKHPEQLNSKTAIDLVQLAMRSGRLALGLNPDKPGTTSGSSTGPRVSIINQNSNTGDGGSSVQGAFDLSDVEKKTEENSQDVANLQSVLHVLNASGAFDVAAGQVKSKTQEYDDDGNPIETDENYVEADYTPDE